MNYEICHDIEIKKSKRLENEVAILKRIKRKMRCKIWLVNLWTDIRGAIPCALIRVVDNL